MNKGSPEKFDYLFKIVVIGDTSVGKTNLISRLVKNEFTHSSKSTIGVDFATKTFKFDETNVKIQLWDTAGQERYHAIVSAYYRGSAGAVVVYDISNPSSFENIRTIWLKNLRSVSDNSMPLMLLGNKQDLVTDKKVTKSQGEELALSENMVFFETSALTGDNVQKAFETFVKRIYEREMIKEVQQSKDSLDEKRLKISSTLPKKKKNRWCC